MGGKATSFLIQGTHTHLFRQTNTFPPRASLYLGQANTQDSLHRLGLPTVGQAGLVCAGHPSPGKQTRPMCGSPVAPILKTQEGHNDLSWFMLLNPMFSSVVFFMLGNAQIRDYNGEDQGNSGGDCSASVFCKPD
jgi:hypothetical protein